MFALKWQNFVQLTSETKLYQQINKFKALFQKARKIANAHNIDPVIVYFFSYIVEGREKNVWQNFFYDVINFGPADKLNLRQFVNLI
jgi:hypothetical protein